MLLEAAGERSAEDESAAMPAVAALSPADPPPPGAGAAPPNTDGMPTPVNPAGWRPLFMSLLMLALPIMAEHLLHIGVGLTDTFLANNMVPTRGLAGEALAQARVANAHAAAAIGSTTYVTWFLGLITGAVGTGSTALIARATGARDRRTARRAVGQSILLGFTAGLVLSAGLFLFSDRIAGIFGFEDPLVTAMIGKFLWVMGFAAPLITVTFLGNACLRGAGDTVTPAIAMIVIDTVNIILAFGLCYGWGPLPQLGFVGIACGTAIAYGGGAFVVLAALIAGIGRSGLKLYPHRLRPDWATARRILRVGIPSGAEGLIFWGANFVVLYVVNTLGEVQAAAHNIAIRVESLSYMTGFAVATAAATMVGHALGAGDPVRARRAGYVAFALGGGMMALAGLMFILVNGPLARAINDDPAVASETASLLFVVGFAQVPFAAMMVFGGCLRGAGDTTSVMLRNLGSAILVRMLGVILATQVLGYGLTAVWVVLSIDLTVRGVLLFARFYSGRWTAATV